MSVELEPLELGFKRPFTQEVAQTLKLKNHHSDPVAFKVKTTAPKQYCVRPNSGKIEAGGEVEVQVLLQAMREDPPLDAKCKDKFLVQSVAIPADKDSGNVASVWQSIEQTNKGSISEKKIRVNFLPPGADNERASTPQRQVNGVSNADSTPAQSSPTMMSFTPSDRSEIPAERPQSFANTVAAGATSAGAAVQSTARSAVNAVPTSTDELKQQLAAAQAQIEQLKKQISEQNILRQRKTDGASSAREEKGGVTQQLQQAPGGVPLQITAILCLISFILAYILF